MSEKRKHKRANLIYYLEVQDQNTGECIGHLVDISNGGIKLISELKTTPGNERDIRIFLPEASSQKSITIKARACWTAKDINPDYNASGFEFIELSEENKDIIKRLINRYEIGKNSANLSR